MSAKSDLNRRPSERQYDALPTELLAEPKEYQYKNMIYSIMKKFKNCGMKKDGLHMCNLKFKS